MLEPGSRSELFWAPAQQTPGAAPGSAVVAADTRSCSGPCFRAGGCWELLSDQTLGSEQLPGIDAVGLQGSAMGGGNGITPVNLLSPTMACTIVAKFFLPREGHSLLTSQNWYKALLVTAATCLFSSWPVWGTRFVLFIMFDF